MDISGVIGVRASDDTLTLLLIPTQRKRACGQTNQARRTQVKILEQSSLRTHRDELVKINLEHRVGVGLGILNRILPRSRRNLYSANEGGYQECRTYNRKNGGKYFHRDRSLKYNPVFVQALLAFNGFADSQRE
jgi:hypothetical protein